MVRTSTESNSPSKRTAKLTDAAKKPARKTLKVKAETIVLSSTPEPFNLDEMIATAAYYLAEKRHFEPGHELEDWLNAEQQVTKLNVGHLSS